MNEFLWRFFCFTIVEEHPCVQAVDRFAKMSYVSHWFPWRIAVGRSVYLHIITAAAVWSTVARTTDVRMVWNRKNTRIKYVA